MAQPFRMCLEAITGAVPLSAPQSAAIVLQVADRLDHWIRTKEPDAVVVPTFVDVEITRGGDVWWCRGQVVPSRDVVAALGTLLDSLLQRVGRVRTPAGLLYVVARATDRRHLAPFEDLWAFRTAVARHTPEQPPQAVDALLSQYFMRQSGLQPLNEQSTISDVRRLRRAGGVPLPTIATDTKIPISLLREFEWGVYANWSLVHARASIEAYAVRAGLDPEAVIAVVSREQVEQEEALVPALTTLPGDSTVVAPVPLVPLLLALVVVFLVAALAPSSDQPRPRYRTRLSATATVSSTVVPAAIPAFNLGNRGAARNAALTPPQKAAARRIRQATAARTVGRSPGEAPAPAHPFTRLARAITGDGRHKVEPFPRPK